MRGTVEERFYSKIAITPGCWIWLASKIKGYGYFKIAGFGHRAHRVSYMLNIGEIPNGLHVCHKCDNPKCVNPDHLFLGTNEDNMNDKIAKGRQSRVRTKGNTIYPIEMVQNIRAARESGMSYAKIAEKFGVARSYAFNVATMKARNLD